MVTENPPRTEPDNFEGLVFDPIVVVDLLPMSDVVVLSDESEDNRSNKSTSKKDESALTSSSDVDDSGPSTSNDNGTSRQQKKKKIAEMSEESEYEESQSESEEEELVEDEISEKESESSSRSDSVKRTKNSKPTTTPRRRRLASISSLSSIDSTPPASPKRKSNKRAAESDSSVDSSSPRKRKTKRRRIRKATDDEDEEDGSKSEDNEDGAESSQKKRRGRRLLTREELAKETIDAEDAEKERQLRLEQRQKEFNGIEFVPDVENGGIKKLKAIILDDDKNAENPNPVLVHPQLVKLALPHQADGIKFMYECVVESLELFRKNPTGGGGILAHCMGLGKTFSTIAFIHTVLSHSELSKKISKVLVVVPKNVVLNWKNEFEKWLFSGGRYLECFDVMELDSFKADHDRLMCLKNWHSSKTPSVMIIGYDMFRILTQSDDDRSKAAKNKQNLKAKKLNKKQKKFLELQKEFRKYLQDPGPDMVICDEGHKLKNDESILSKTMMKIRTRRRVCLTGTPLQNNLIEYHVMVSFVKPGLLGTKSEFSNRFANPINRGRTKDAVPSEVSFMKRRCHVLFERLKNIVQRKELSVLKSELPEKQEFVLYIRMTKPQIELYELFLKNVDKEIKLDLRKRLLPDYHQLSRIWTHPYQLIAHAREQERKAILADDLGGFIVDSDEESSSDIDLDDGDSDVGEESRPKVGGTRKSNRLAGVEVDSRPPTPLDGIGWWTETGIVSEADMYNLEMSNKLIVLFDIIKRCEAIGDKLLVFSQSLESLRLIRNFLEYFDETDSWFVDGHECLASKGERWGWKEGRDYLVIDGSVGSHDREALQYTFNNKRQLRARLMLISTRAGSLGTNMIAANRVVIFDACWNPSHDTQSLFRIYRIGQVKPSYIYRLIAQGTMEERIYKRQVTKESTALRVVDEYQIQRHFHGHDLEELYCFDPQPFVPGTKNMAPPKDKLLAEVILTHPQCIVDYIIHESLFENQEDEKLTPEECAAAWEDYEREKRGIPSGILNNVSNHPGTNYGMDPALAIFIKQDAIYGIAISAGFTEYQATRLAYIKIVLHKLLEKAPQIGILEFGRLITNIMRHFKGETAVAEAIRLFRTAEPYFRQTGVNETLGRLMVYSPWLFDFSTTSNGPVSVAGSLFV